MRYRRQRRQHGGVGNKSVEPFPPPGNEVAYDKALAIDPKHKGALEYKGELYLTLGNLEGAENMFDRLNKVCFLSCKEKKQLAAAIRTYKKAN